MEGLVALALVATSTPSDHFKMNTNNTPATEESFVAQTDTPRTDDRSSDHIGFWSCATVPSSFARQLERELSHSLANQLKTQAEVKEIRAALGDDGRRTHNEVLELATKASEWRTWKDKYIDLKNAHIAEGQDPAGTIWEHADKLQKELKASKAEVDRLKEKDPIISSKTTHYHHESYCRKCGLTELE
jgi:hypothetical protein